MTVLAPRIYVKFHIPTVGTALLLFGKNLILVLTNNSSFPKIGPLLAQLTKAVADFEAAQAAVHTRALGAIAARNRARAALTVVLRQVRTHIQQVAETHPDDAESIAQSLGLSLSKPARRTKPPLTVKPGKLSGSVELVARAPGGRASHEWQWSTDGKSWTAAPSTLRARTVIAGLTPATLVYFRHRVITKDGPSEWGQVVSAIIQ